MSTRPQFIDEAWTAPTGEQFPEGTKFIMTASLGTYEWVKPDGERGESWFADWQIGED